MKKYLALFIIPFLFSSCDFSKLTFVGTLNETIRFDLDTTGSFSSIEEKSSDEIAKNILDLNLSSVEDYRVTKVNIRDAELDFIYSNGNTATKLDNFHLVLTDREGLKDVVFANLIETGVELPGENWESQIASQIKISRYLNAVGVDAVREIVEKALQLPSSTEGIVMKAEGTIPDGERFKAVLLVNLVIDIEYVTCEEVMIGVAGEACVD